MHLLIVLCLCLVWTTCQAQTVQSKVELHTIYLPQFTVQEASGNNVQATGVRLMFSHYDLKPLEFGFNGYAGYGEVARASFGFNLAYLFAELKSLDFKIGLGLSKIDLEDVEVNEDEFGPHVGDASFTGMGNEFKPYIECEWNFSKFSSLFLQAGYRVINGEKSVVTSVEPIDDPLVEKRISGRDESFFYSASGFDIGVGMNIIF